MSEQKKVLLVAEEKTRTAQAIAQDLEAFNRMPLMREAQVALLKFVRLLNPIYMMMCEQACTGKPHPDEVNIFTFSGSGASDATLVKQFRELMGDERLALAEFDRMTGGQRDDN